MRKAVSLMSGGLDSTCYTLLKLQEGYVIYPLYVDYGHLASKNEWKALRKICATLSLQPVKAIVSLDAWKQSNLQLFSGELTKEYDTSIIVPARNMLFISIAASYAKVVGADAILYGATLEEAHLFPDCSPEFAKALEATLRMGGVDVKVLSPAVEGIDIKTLITEGAKVQKEVLHYAWSCYGGGLEQCGKCYACLRRKEKLGWLDVNPSYR